MMESKADWVLSNGQVIPSDDARISPFDGGYLHGAGVFETMRAYAGRPFVYARHLERMARSIDALDLPIAREGLPSIEQVRGLLARNGLSDARIRVTAGVGRPSGDGSPSTPNVLVTATAGPFYPAELYEQGMIVAICDFKLSPTDPIARHKTLNYLPRLLSLQAARRKMCGEAIWFTTDNQLAEGAVSNVFVVKGGRLKTPPEDIPILPGITRAVVLEIAPSENLPAEAGPLTIDDLLDADEVFLTNSIMQIMPVKQVERKTIANGRPGPITRKIAAAYRERVERNSG